MNGVKEGANQEIGVPRDIPRGVHRGARGANPSVRHPEIKLLSSGTNIFVVDVLPDTDCSLVGMKIKTRVAIIV